MITKYKELVEKYIIVILGIIILGLLYENKTNIESAVTSFLALLTPFIIGFLIAYLLNPIINLGIEKLKLKRGIAILGVYLVLFISMISLFTVIVPTIVSSSVEIVNSVPSSDDVINKFLSLVNIVYVKKIILKIFEQFNDKVPVIINSVFSNIGNLFGNLTKFIMTITMGVIISIYATIDKDNLIKLGKNCIYTICGKNKTEKSIKALKNCDEIFKKFLGGISLEALIIGILAIIGMCILKVKYATLLGLIIGVTNIIPYVGPFIGALPAVIVTLFYSPIKALKVAVFILILQQFDSNYLNPKIMGNAVGLSPVWIIFALSVGGSYFGLLGMVLAVPVAAMIKIFLLPLIREYE